MPGAVSDNAMDWSTFERTPSVCAVCGEVTQRPKIIFDGKGSRIYCRLHVPPAHARGNADVAKNVFENFTLDHFPVDESGRKITVNSLKELRTAEKRTGCVLAIASDNDISQPPQHDRDAGNIARNYEWKWAKDPEQRKRNSTEGVSTGMAKSAKDTLADAPRPI